MDFKKTLKSLEWQRLQEELSLRARSAGGQSLAKNFLPPQMQQEQTFAFPHDSAEAVLELWQLKLRESQQVPVGTASDLSDLFSRVERLGAIDVAELRSLLESHHRFQDFQHFLRRHGAKLDALARWSRSSGILETDQKASLDAWCKAESSLLNAQGEIADSASEDLAALHSLAGELHRKIRKRLDEYLKNSRLLEYLQDDYITLREGRYVLPLRSNFKGRVPGIVHDVSNSEATLFVEPEEVVEWNNQLRVTEREIEQEIERILRDFVARTKDRVPALKAQAHLLSLCDLFSAFVQLALDTGLTLCCAEVSDEHLSFERLSHPLLQLDRNVVRNSLAWSQGFVLSGPNTGGKTVLLKSVGLNVLLARSGLPCFADRVLLPARLQRVFVSVGDEQNLRENLSTFSAHLRMLSDMYAAANAGDLILIDEIATGTSPEEGQPLAQAFLEKLLDRQIAFFVTTHYSALKQFALSDTRCRIASMAFDKQSRRPTYEIIMDIPGESSAFETADSVGFAPEVLQRARVIRGEPSADLGLALEKLDEARHRFLDREKELADKLDRARRREEQAQKSIEEYGLRQKVLLSEESQRLLKQFLALKDELSAQIRALSKEDLQEGAQKSFNKIAEAMAHVRVQTEELSASDNETRKLEDGDIEAGQVVEIDGLGLGEVLERPSTVSAKTLILVQVGELRTRVARERLQKVSGQRARSHKRNRETHASLSEKSKPSVLTTASPSTNSQGSTICDVRGKSVEDALKRVDQGLNSLLGGAQVLTIIHGHGTSRLKDAIRSYLQDKRPDIRYREGSWPGEGGDGVTLAQLDD